MKRAEPRTTTDMTPISKPCTPVSIQRLPQVLNLDCFTRLFLRFTQSNFAKVEMRSLQGIPFVFPRARNGPFCKQGEITLQRIRRSMAQRPWQWFLAVYTPQTVLRSFKSFK